MFTHCRCSHVHILEVLRGVLYPEAHNNRFKKKKGTRTSEHTMTITVSYIDVIYLYDTIAPWSELLVHGLSLGKAQPHTFVSHSSRTAGLRNVIEACTFNNLIFVAFISSRISSVWIDSNRDIIFPLCTAMSSRRSGYSIHIC